MPAVTMYSKTTCPFCDRARRLLEERGVVALDLIQIDEHPERRAEMIRLAGRSTVPQIFIGGRHVGGCDDLVALDRAGGLAPLLAGAS